LSVLLETLRLLPGAPPHLGAEALNVGLTRDKKPASFFLPPHQALSNLFLTGRRHLLRPLLQTLATAEFA
jgi:hypothetical protein